MTHLMTLIGKQYHIDSDQVKITHNLSSAPVVIRALRAGPLEFILAINLKMPEIIEILRFITPSPINKKRKNNSEMLRNFANNLDPGQARLNVRPDLDPNSLTLILYSLNIFSKKVDFEKDQQTTIKHDTMQSQQIVNELSMRK